MKTIIAGSRDITDFRVVCDALIASGWWYEISQVVSGRCRGVDRLGELWAEAAGVLIMPFEVSPQEWDAYGKPAGPMRNRRMAEYADALLLVWDGASRGSRSMLEIAQEYQLSIYQHIVRG